jgi:hypothetical protein
MGDLWCIEHFVFEIGEDYGITDGILDHPVCDALFEMLVVFTECLEKLADEGTFGLRLLRHDKILPLAPDIVGRRWMVGFVDGLPVSWLQGAMSGFGN